MKMIVPVLGLWISTFAQAASVPVCERTAPIAQFLEQYLAKPCAEITDADLATVPRIAVPGRGITEFKAGDFSGLPALEILNIKSNPFTSFDATLLDELPNLKTLVLLKTNLAALPEGFLAKNPLIENLYLSRNMFNTIPEAVWNRFETYEHWVELELDTELDELSGGRASKIFSPESGVSIIWI